MYFQSSLTPAQRELRTRRLSNMINRFHATLLTELDPTTGEALRDSCPLDFPVPHAPA